MSLFFQPPPACRHVFIHGLQLQASIGIYDNEKQQTQPIQIDIDAFVPLFNCTPIADDIAEVVDYHYLYQVAKQIGLSRHIHLQETLCDELMAAVLAHPKIIAARVQVAKVTAYPDCHAVGVSVYQQKESVIR